METLQEQYKKEVIPALMKKFNYKSVMQVPKLENIEQEESQHEIDGEVEGIAFCKIECDEDK